MVAAYKYIVDTGTVSVDSQDVLTDVEKEWKAAFGNTLDVRSSTPQGTMIGAEATNRVGLMKNNADMANLLNPNLSYGTALDAVCALLGAGRGKNTSTVGDGVAISGDIGTVIQAGFRVKTASGDVFRAVEQVTIGDSGAASATFASADFGPIALPVGTLEIVDAVIGWGSATVTTNTSVSLGTNELDDAQLKTHRSQTLYAQGLSSTGAIRAHLLATPNVKSVRLAENITGAAGLTQGITFVGTGGIWICVDGAAPDADIASAIHAARQGSCPYDYGTNNGTPVAAPNGVPVIDPYSGNVYNVKFTRAVQMDVYIRMSAKKGTSSASNIAMQRTIMQFAQGMIEGEEGFVVGASISSFEVAGAICRTYPGLYVSSCSVAVVAKGGAAPIDSDYKNEFVMDPWKIGILAIGNITVNLS